MRTVALTLQRKSGVVIAVGGALFIAATTLTPSVMTAPLFRRSCIPLWCDERPLLDVIDNVALFIPLAFGLRRAGVRNAHIIIALSAASAIIELLQLHVIPGRDANARDWIANTAGSVAGIGLAASLERWLFPKASAARFLAVMMGCVWLGLTLLGAWGLGPGPTRPRYWGQLSPENGGPITYRGEVLSASINGHAIASGPLTEEETDSVRATLRNGRLRLTARVGAPADGGGMRPIVRIVDGEGWGIASLAQFGSALVFRARLRAADIWLQTPSVRAPRVFPVAPSVSGWTQLDLSGELDGRVLRVSAEREGIMSVARLHPQLVWTFFVPWDIPLDHRAVWLTAAWLFFMLFPFGYWLSQTGMRPVAGLATLGGLGALGLFVIPAVLRFDVGGSAEWMTLIVGGITGWMTGALVSRTE